MHIYIHLDPRFTSTDRRDDLLVHRERDPAAHLHEWSARRREHTSANTHNEACEPRSRAPPELTEALFVEDAVRAVERVTVLRAGLKRLHPRLHYAVHYQLPHLLNQTRKTHSSGMVVYTVTSPASAPIPNVTPAGSGCPGRAWPCTSCLRPVYVEKRIAEFADCRIIYTPGVSVGRAGKRHDVRRGRSLGRCHGSPRHERSRPYRERVHDTEGRDAWRRR
jgi:hypothetical protein